MLDKNASHLNIMMKLPNTRRFPISNTSRPLHFFTGNVKRQQKRYRALQINAVQSESYYHLVKSVIVGVQDLIPDYHTSTNTS